MPVEPTDKVRDVIAGIRVRVLDILRPPSPLIGTPPEPFPAEAKLLRDVFNAYDNLDTEIATALSEVTNIRTNGQLTEDARRANARTVIDALDTSVNAQLEWAAASIDWMINNITTSTIPQRPQPVDAAQEAALSGLKDDLRMSLDGLTGINVSRRLLELTEKYAADGNHLATWLLAGSDWPALYLQSRGLDTIVWDASLPRALTAFDADTAVEARRILAVLAGPRGLKAALVAMRYMTRSRIDAIRTATGR